MGLSLLCNDIGWRKQNNKTSRIKNNKTKTPGIRYDLHPLVAVTNVYQWGFKGLNFHWGQMRQYTYQEVVGGLYKVDEMELRDLRTIPFGRIVLNS